MHKPEGLVCVCGLFMLTLPGIAQAGSLAPADKQFLDEAARMEMTMAHEAEMAESHASRAEVKDFGKMLAKDNSDGYNKLFTVANKVNAPIPRGINAGKIPAVRRLSAVNGSRFDREFAADEIAAEQREIALFQREAAHGRDADLKAYANEMLPVLNNDLKRARECTHGKAK